MNRRRLEWREISRQKDIYNRNIVLACVRFKYNLDLETNRHKKSGEIMMFDNTQKEDLKREVADCLRREKEVRKIILFGSFISRSDPHDMDVAVFQDSRQDYLSLALKYRRLIRPVAERIPVDVVPIKSDADGGMFLDEIEKGEVIYER